jgi:hypothetical protein
MFAFFGDSHSRQFVGTSWGTFLHYVFSGATIAGLASRRSTTGHAQIIRHALAHKGSKVVFLMLGQVDMDFTFHRQLCLDSLADDGSFQQRRAAIYEGFVRSIVEDAALMAEIAQICVLAPQVSPLDDADFIPITAEQARVPEARLREVATVLDLSHKARIRRTVALNDRLEAAFSGMHAVRFCRIDHKMQAMMDRDPGVFRSEGRVDHHPNPNETIKLWAPFIRRFVDDCR